MKNLTAEQKAQRALDVLEVQNCMSRHAYYHGAGMHAEELEKNWVKKTPNPTFAMNFGKWVGYESIKKCYVDAGPIINGAGLEALSRQFPDIEVKEENMGIGNLVIHAQTTPIIEIAGDGQTAKGIWVTPGVVTLPFPQLQAWWMWEKYGADFVKEEGEWRMWHLAMFTDFGVPMGEPILSNQANGADAMVMPPGVPEPDEKFEMYKMYSPYTKPVLLPRLPEPYETFSETFSY
ncbi:MAG: nuclear transport factor 2 family protein [Thermoleophilia bacterium]|nr:nuclear transport factor 2 family protein [Thermoleophilia bacterium]